MMFKVKLPLLPMFALPVTCQYALSIVHSGLTVWCSKCHDSSIHFTLCKKRKTRVIVASYSGLFLETPVSHPCVQMNLKVM